MSSRLVPTGYGPTHTGEANEDEEEIANLTAQKMAVTAELNEYLTKAKNARLLLKGIELEIEELQAKLLEKTDRQKGSTKSYPDGRKQIDSFGDRPPRNEKFNHLGPLDDTSLKLNVNYVSPKSERKDERGYPQSDNQPIKRNASINNRTLSSQTIGCSKCGSKDHGAYECNKQVENPELENKRRNSVLKRIEDKKDQIRNSPRSIDEKRKEILRLEWKIQRIKEEWKNTDDQYKGCVPDHSTIPKTNTESPNSENQARNETVTQITSETENEAERNEVTSKTSHEKEVNVKTTTKPTTEKRAHDSANSKINSEENPESKGTQKLTKNQRKKFAAKTETIEEKLRRVQQRADLLSWDNNHSLFRTRDETNDEWNIRLIEYYEDLIYHETNGKEGKPKTDPKASVGKGGKSDTSAMNANIGISKRSDDTKPATSNSSNSVKPTNESQPDMEGDLSTELGSKVF